MLQRITIFFLILFAALFLKACAPTNYVYVKKSNPEAKSHKINQVMIMVEYLAIKDDLKGFWNFEENSNLDNQDKLHNIAANMLKAKGYDLANMALKSSGLIINREYLVDHMIGKQKQSVPIEPPYILRSINLENTTIQGLESLLFELNAPISAVMSDMRSFVKNNFISETQALNMTSDTAILIIQSYKPRVSIFADMQVDLVTSSYGSSAYVHLNNRNRPTTYAYLIHVGTGDLLWSNKTTLISDKNQQKFFFELPMN
ncbi:MAG: hypothetical protein L3J83_04210 [Proteobacteria bacterium]|nr:hypothetical protein [Pseudomonadota bacterium]